MVSLRLPRPVHLVLGLALLAFSACKEDSDTPPVLTTLTVTLPAAQVQMGQTETATVAGADQNGSIIDPGTVTWSSSASAVATVSTTGVVTGVTTGTAQITATSGTRTGQRTVTVVAPAAIVLNEVESNGGTPGDWAEFYNPTASAVDMSGWVMKDNDDTHIYTFPAGTTIAAGGYLVADEANFVFGLGAPDAVRLYSPYAVLVTSYTWTAHAATTYGRCPDKTGAFTTTTSSTKGAANDCTPSVRINEVESNGGVPDDWIELYNAGATTADISGYILKDNDDTHSFPIPAGTTLAPGAVAAFDVAVNFGLGAADAARLFTPTGTLIDSYTWTAHATTTYGRCPDGTGDFVTTVASTKGTLNSCGTTTPTGSPWPGTDDVHTVAGISVYGGNLSGLIYEDAAGGNPAVLWGIRNGPGTLFRLILSGGIWTPDPANGWSAGKNVKYSDGLLTSDPDAEGVTFSGTGSAGGIYVSTERNNSANTVSRLSVLRYRPQRRRHQPDRDQRLEPHERSSGRRREPRSRRHYLRAGLIPRGSGILRRGRGTHLRAGRLRESWHGALLRRARGERNDLRVRAQSCHKWVHARGHDRERVSRGHGSAVRSRAQVPVGHLRRWVWWSIRDSRNQYDDRLPDEGEVPDHQPVQPPQQHAEPEQRRLRDGHAGHVCRRVQGGLVVG